mmetsp:Transcript_56406/g.150897  ORF Transcript_56406/g.150897 Transcript_56406/m.150897 type:complete len:125 (+) Transcript_56406:120-494(+)
MSRLRCVTSFIAGHQDSVVQGRRGDLTVARRFCTLRAISCILDNTINLEGSSFSVSDIEAKNSKPFELRVRLSPARGDVADLVDGTTREFAHPSSLRSWVTSEPDSKGSVLEPSRDPDKLESTL